MIFSRYLILTQYDDIIPLYYIICKLNSHIKDMKLYTVANCSMMHMLEHSCSPNASFSVYRRDEEFVILLISLRKIAKEEAITVNRFNKTSSLTQYYKSRRTYCPCKTKECKYYFTFFAYYLLNAGFYCRYMKNDLFNNEEVKNKAKELAKLVHRSLLLMI